MNENDLNEFDNQMRSIAHEMRRQMKPCDEVVARVIEGPPTTQEQGSVCEDEQLPTAQILPFVQTTRARRKRNRALGIAAAAAAAVAVVVGGLSVVNNLAFGPLSSTSPASSETAYSGVVSEGIVTPGSYGELYDSLKNRVFDAYRQGYGVDAETIAPLAAASQGSANSQESASADTAIPQYGTADPSITAQATGNDYSQTNTQVAGVDEADVVKTDGRFIYSLSHNEIVITKADGRNTKELSRIRLNLGAPQNFYVVDDRLVVMHSGDSLYHNGYSPKCFASIYDLSNPESPELLNSFGQDGYLQDSRLTEGMLYLVSVYTVSADTAEKENPSSFVPNSYESFAANLSEPEASPQPFAPCDIRIMPDYSSPQFTVITALDVVGAQRVSELSLLGNTSTVYLNQNNLFLAASNNSYGQIMPLIIEDAEVRTLQRIPLLPWEILSYLIDPDLWYSMQSVDALPDTDMPPAPQTTRISRIALGEGALELAASTLIEGVLLNQFSLDEYEGYLRVAVTVNKPSEPEQNEDWPGFWGTTITANNLLVLDSSLEVVGSIEDLAPGERIYSARFTGDVGYLVTFRETDPLFSLDLSSPEHPQVRDALKIPGFSQYLHPYADGLLLGLGQDTTGGGMQTGYLKLSMFDVSDPFAISEAHKTLIDAYYAEALMNHKAVLINADKNIIGFEVIADASRLYEDDSLAGQLPDEMYSPAYSFAYSKYVIFGYDDTLGLYERAAILLPDNYLNTRALYIDDYLYIVCGERIGVFTLDTFEKVLWITM
jgi:uncharacterized secreted protein with C-terminal beta-propeller domain